MSSSGRRTICPDCGEWVDWSDDGIFDHTCRAKNWARRQEDAELGAIRRLNVRQCLEQVRLGHDNRSLRFMGFADGCINEARRYHDAESHPYNYNNPPLSDLQSKGDRDE